MSARGASRVADASSWVAEWLGRLLGVELLGDRPGDVLFVADNTAISLGGGNVKPSGSDVVDRIIVHCAYLYTTRRVTEGYVPAEHDTGWQTLVAQAQKLADELAKQSLRGDLTSSLPYLSIVAPHSLLLADGGLCVRPSVVLTKIYDAEIATLRSACSLPALGSAGGSWETIISQSLIPTVAVRSALWLRSSSSFKVSPTTAYCHFCGLHVAQWSFHFRSLCPRIVIATAAGFKAILYQLSILGWNSSTSFLWSAHCTSAGGEVLDVVMGTEYQLTSAAESSLCCSWSGLVWVQGSPTCEHPAMSQSQCTLVAEAYLKAFHRFVAQADILPALLDESAFVCPLSTPSHVPWGVRVVLSLVMVLTHASASIGIFLPGPPWLTDDRCDIALIWDNHPEALIARWLRIHASCISPVESRQRIVLINGLTLEWEGCGQTSTLAHLELAMASL